MYDHGAQANILPCTTHHSLGHSHPCIPQAISDPADLCDLLFALKPRSVLSEAGLYAGLEKAAGLALSQTGQTRPAAAAAAVAAAAAGAAAGGPGASSQGGAGGSSEECDIDKVAAVCTAIREAVRSLDASGGANGDVGQPGVTWGMRYLKVVVTSYARSNPQDLEAALQAIRAVKEASLVIDPQPAVTMTPSAVVMDGGSEGEDDDFEEALGGSAVGVTGSAGVTGESLGAASDGALRHLLLHVDPDVLYRCALGLYDLGLAFMVVSHAQKDPGEYLDELSRFGAVQVRGSAMLQHSVRVNPRMS